MIPERTTKMVFDYWVKSGIINKPDHDFWQFYKLKPGDVYVDGGSFIGRNAIRAASMIGEEKGEII